MGIVLAKRNDTDAVLAAEIAAVRREHIHLSTKDVELVAHGRLLLKSEAPREGSARERYDFVVEQIRRGEPGKSIKEVRALAWNSLTDDEQIALLREESEMEKLDRSELFADWYARLDASERRRFRAQQADIDRALNDRTGVAQTEGRGGGPFNGHPTSPNIAPKAPRAPKFEKGDTLRAIVKSHGLVPLCKLINDENNAFRISESDLMVLAGEHAAAQGQTLGKLLNGNSGDGQMIAKAAAICRQATYAAQAQNTFDSLKKRLG
jgi:hypothetical protein